MKINIYDKHHPLNKRPVICVETGEHFESVCEAARQKNCSKSGIFACLIGDREYCGGYHWAYDVLKNKQGE